MEEGTRFSTIYNRFLEKITDDMYSEFMTPQDTIRDLQSLLKDALPGFEFPRVNLYDYTISEEIIPAEDVTDEDFVIRDVILEEVDDSSDSGEDPVPQVVIDNSYFSAVLTPEEVNILAIIMKQGWVQRQLTSIENTRMKYSGADFKMTSQANHMAKLKELLDESRRDSLHNQRLYKRRKLKDDGSYRSNWSILRKSNADEEI
jgi:hypothetical protein